MGTLTFTQNGQTFDTMTDDPTQAEAVQSEIMELSRPNLPEMFGNKGSPTGIIPPNLMLHSMLALSNSANEQAGLIKNQIPLIDDTGWELDDDGRLIVTLKDPNDPSRFDRGYVNAPSFSEMDVSMGIHQAGLFLPAAKVAGAVTMGPRLLINPMFRAATSGVAAGTTEKIRQWSVKQMAGENFEADQEENAKFLALTAGLGVAGEMIGPMASFMQRFVRNKANMSGPATLSAHGEKIFKRIGIDPQMVQGDVRFFNEFKSSAGMAKKAMGESLVRTRPDLVARLALEREMLPVGAAGANLRMVLDETSAKVSAATILMTDAVAKNGSLKSTFNPDVADQITSVVTDTLLQGGALANQAVRNELKNFRNIFASGKRTQTKLSPADIGDFDPLVRIKSNKTIQGQGSKTAAQAINEYVSWSQGVRAKLKKGQFTNAAEGRGLTEMLQTTDDTIGRMTLDTLVHAKPAEILAMKNVLHLNKELGDVLSTGALLDDIFVNNRTPEESIRMLFGVNEITSKGSSVQALNAMRGLFGAGSMEWISMKDEALRIVFDQGGKEFKRESLQRSFRQAMENNPTIMNTIFDSTDLKNIADIIGASKGSNITKVIGDILTVRYGVHGAAIAGSMRRLGTLTDNLEKARARPLWADTTVLMMTSNASNISGMFSVARPTVDGIRRMLSDTAESAAQMIEPEEETQPTARVVPKMSEGSGFSGSSPSMDNNKRTKNSQKLWEESVHRVDREMKDKPAFPIKEQVSKKELDAFEESIRSFEKKKKKK